MAVDHNNLFELTGREAAARVRDGQISSAELVNACLERINAREDIVQAWQYLDPDYALQQAREADQVRANGQPMGSLHGVPVAVKDIIDTSDMPTENGTVLHAGRQPGEDASVVQLLRSAGAVILGKTVTTELAVYSPGKTRNPHNPEHTPGGSSSGSAAAVADRMVPLAIGSQTNGSVIRPASYCGVYGYKPSHGLIPRSGVLVQSQWLDHVGVFARSLEDIALLAEPLMAYDKHDPDSRPQARAPLLQTTLQEPPVRPRLAFVKTPQWPQAEADSQAAFEKLAVELGADIEELSLPATFDDAVQCHTTILEADLAFRFAREYQQGKAQLSDRLAGMIESGQKISAVDYNRAVEQRAVLAALVDGLLNDYDALLTPATTGTAPHGLQATGSPIFCTTWTLCGAPAITLPLLQGANQLPIGVQLIGARHNDARLLRTARWLVQRVTGTTED